MCRGNPSTRYQIAHDTHFQETHRSLCSFSAHNVPALSNHQPYMFFDLTCVTLRDAIHASHSTAMSTIDTIETMKSAGCKNQNDKKQHPEQRRALTYAMTQPKREHRPTQLLPVVPSLSFPTNESPPKESMHHLWVFLFRTASHSARFHPMKCFSPPTPRIIPLPSTYVVFFFSNHTLFGTCFLMLTIFFGFF